MNRKALAILGAILVLILGTAGTLVYLKYGKKSEPEVSTPVEPTPGGDAEVPPDLETPPDDDVQALPPAVKFFTDQAISPVFMYNGNGVAFLSGNGTLVQLTLISSREGELLVGDRKEYDLADLENISRVVWQPSGDDFLVEKETAGGKRYSVYLYRRGQLVDLPAQVTAVDWVPRNITFGAITDPDILSEIVYLWKDSSGKVTLNVAAADNSRYEQLTEIWEPDDDIRLSPDGKSILFWRTGSQESTNRINLVSADGKIFRAVVKEGYNTGVVWSPNSRDFVFFRKTENGAEEMYLGNVFNSEVKSLGLVSAPDKLFWDPAGETLYAAGTTLEGTGPEKLYRYNLATNSDPESFDLGADVSVTDLSVSTNKDFVIFKDRLSQALYYFFLPQTLEPDLNPELETN